MIKDIFYKRWYVDEVTAHGILDSMDDSLVINYESAVGVYPKVYTNSFILDGFSIKVSFSLDRKTVSFSTKLINLLKLEVDGLELVCSYSIKERIFNKASAIFNKEAIRMENQKEEDKRMLRKDIKLRFGGKL